MHRRSLKRPIAVAVGLVLLAGIGIGSAMALDTRGTDHGQVFSRWSQGARLVFGSRAADPERGFVRLEQRGKTVVFKTPEGDGPLRLAAVLNNAWEFRSSHGALAILDAGWDNDFAKAPPSFEYLGRRLDPAKLGPIGSRGVAVPVEWWLGKTRRSAVVLVEQTGARHGSFGNGWKVDGYLPGFTTPRLAALSKTHAYQSLESAQELRQPLRAPDGRNYSIDVNGQRLVRVGGGTAAATLERYTWEDCTTWPGSKGASYRACGGSITLRRPHRPAATLFRDPVEDFEADGVWTFLQLSPNGRWLLLENANETCSFYTKAEFLPARGGGSDAEVFPGSPTSSEALGWLPDNTALVAGQPQACGGSGTPGIYQVRPGTASSPSTYQLVFPDMADATSWGFKH
jgi:hypothetical protein